MAAMQVRIGSTYNIPDHSGLRIGPEYPMTARFPAESRARRQVPGTEPQRMLPGGARSDPNAPSSSEAVAGDAYRPFPVPESRWLADALGALAEVDDEIAEEELPPVGEATKTEAERIIKALARHPLAPTVYPTQDAEIALHFKAPGRTGTVVILLSDGGRADCHAYVGGTSRRAHYDTSSDLPDAFVLDQLRRLTPDRADAPAPGAGVFPPPTTFLPTSLHLMR